MSWVSTQKLQYFAQEFAKKVDSLFVRKEAGKGLSTNDYDNSAKAKVDAIPADPKYTDTVYTHPESGVEAGTYKSVTVDSKGHVTAGSNPTTLAGYGITDAASKNHTHGSDDITSLDVSKLSGVISIDNLPQGALERCVVVADDNARLALTTAQVQTGDTVKVTSTGLMYFVKDDSKLNSEDGYEVYTAGSASSVPWSGVTNKPETFTPSAHTHTKSEITDFAHNHVLADITDFIEVTEAEIDSIIAGAFTA